MGQKKSIKKNLNLKQKNNLNKKDFFNFWKLTSVIFSVLLLSSVGIFYLFDVNFSKDELLNETDLPGEKIPIVDKKPLSNSSNGNLDNELDIMIENINIVLGKEEIVFDWTFNRCVEEDIPDVPTRAFRNYQDEIVLVSGNSPDTYFMFGQNFYNLEKNCNPVISSTDSFEADSFNNLEWIPSVYTLDGETVFALVHNEYHDPFSINCLQRDTSPRNPCWYNSITSAISNDGGHSFNQNIDQNYVVAFPPFIWDSYFGIDKNNERFNENTSRTLPYGYLSPTNIFKGPDEFYYTFIRAITNPSVQGNQGICLMRSNNLRDINSWRFWDGTSFDGQFLNPYLENDVPVCSFIRGMGNNVRSINYNSYLEKYIAITSGRMAGAENQGICGTWLIISEDLFSWSKPKLIKESSFMYSPCNNSDITMDLYPSIIDHDSPAINFDISDQDMFLYFVRLNRWQNNNLNSLDRDLIRVELNFKIK